MPNNTQFPPGTAVVSTGDETLRGIVTAAPAPGLRSVDWNDGDHGDVDVRDLRTV